MVSKDITVGMELGTRERSRDFMQFVTKANEFDSVISIGYKNRKANAKSLLGVMALELADGMAVTMTADGPDEAEALSALAALLA